MRCRCLWFYLLCCPFCLLPRLTLAEGKTQQSLFAACLTESTRNQADSQESSARTRAAELLDKGMAAFNHRNYDQAEGFYKQAMELDPRYAQPYNDLGVLYKEVKKDFEAAELYYKQAIALDPKYAQAYNSLGVLYKNVKQDYEAAERSYKQAIEADPKYAPSYNNLGNLYAEIKHDYTAAERSYKQAIEVDPRYAHSYSDLGNLYYSKKDYGAAERSYKQATEADPRFATAYANLALAQLRQGRRERALENARKARELGLKDHPAYRELGL